MLKEEIESYPGKITLPPSRAYNDFEFYEVELNDEFIVDFHLWFDGEKSDLMISVLFYHSSPELKFSFWDMLVP